MSNEKHKEEASLYVSKEARDIARRRKPLTAKKLLKFLSDLERRGVDMNKLTLNFRQDYNSDVEEITAVEEDLYDAKTNNVLESIVFIVDTREV